MSIASLSNFSVPINPGSGDNTSMLMPKLKYRFKVIFDGFGVSADVTELTKQIAEAARPNVEFPDQKIEVYNSIIHYAGKPSWKPISIKIRDDSTGVVNKIIGEQNQKQFDFFEQSSAAAAGDYKFKMTIQMLDGGNSGNFVDASILETWECYGCYILSTNFNALTYADAGTAMIIEMSIQPDNCVQTVGGGIGDSQTTRTPGTSAVGGTGAAA
jgi:hypothetical protein